MLNVSSMAIFFFFFFFFVELADEDEACVVLVEVSRCLADGWSTR